MKREEAYQQVFENMDVMRRVMHAHFQRSFTNIQLSPSQLQLLMIVAAKAPVQPKDLAAKLCLTPGALTQLIESAEQQGFVERKPDGKDRRTVCVSLTRKGKRKVASIKKAREQLLGEAMRALDDAELQAFAEIQQKMIRYFTEQEAKRHAQDKANKEHTK